MIILGDGGYSGMGYVMAHLLVKLYPLQACPRMCLLVEDVKVSVWGGVTTWTADEPLHNLYHGSHHRQLRSMWRSLYNLWSYLAIVGSLQPIHSSPTIAKYQKIVIGNSRATMDGLQWTDHRQVRSKIVLGDGRSTLVGPWWNHHRQVRSKSKKYSSKSLSQSKSLSHTPAQHTSCYCLHTGSFCWNRHCPKPMNSQVS